MWYDGVDANCDGNDGDQDGDGYYVVGYSFAIPADFEAGDCDDLAAGTYPGATETWYDGVDADCAGDDDFDQDYDNQRAAAWGGEDCNDTDGTIYAGAPDVWYDGVDSDCAGNDDFDQDGDGYSTDDCDDLAFGVNPAALEDCSTADDDNCDGDTNDLGAAGCSEWYEDADGDGYGAAEACLCLATAVYSIGTGDDCDDGDGTVSPAATEVCNDGVDNDCDGGAGACALTGGSLSGADAEYTGEAAGDYAGVAVSGAGDFNDDGFDDMLVGASYNDDGGGGAGAAYLLLGNAAPVGGSLSAGIEYYGEAAGDYAAGALAPGGDVNGDGYSDFLIGASQNSDGGSGAGAAFLVLGSASTSGGSVSSGLEFSGSAVGDFAGISVAGGGDVNGDGFDDFAIGAYARSGGKGGVYLVLGSASLAAHSLASAVQYGGESAGDWAGNTASMAGDIDGDGLEDLLIGAPGKGGYAGAAYLVLGAAVPSSYALASAPTYTGEDIGDNAGWSLAAAGDVNGDGSADFLVGAAGAGSSGEGVVYLVLGGGSLAGGPLSAEIQYAGEAPGDQAAEVAGVGDIDADGFDDVVVGANSNSDAGTWAGATYIIPGNAAPAGGAVATGAKYVGEATSNFVGYGVAGVGDVNADGFADTLVGAYGNGDAAPDAGAAYLILGQGL